jgi:GxxExxY protein
MPDRDKLTERIIACAIEVHRQLGPGLLEGAYEEALCIEFKAAGLGHRRQVAFPVVYKGHRIGEYRVDLIVEDQVVVEIKNVERSDPVFDAQVLTYLRVTGKKDRPPHQQLQLPAAEEWNQAIHPMKLFLEMLSSVSLCLCG